MSEAIKHKILLFNNYNEQDLYISLALFCLGRHLCVRVCDQGVTCYLLFIVVFV